MSTPNMNLTVSTIGVDSGLNWEMNLNSSLTAIDSHNHSSGQGVQIQPNGININTALPFNGNAATALQAAIFQDQTSLATLNALYTIAGELYFNDPTGPVQITLGGSVNATSSGIASGTATASFVSSVLVVNEASNTPANIQVGSVLIGNNIASSNFVTLSAVSALASSYSLVLPQLPASQKIMTLDSSGNITAPYVVDNSTLTISANTIQVASGGITSTQLAANSVTTSAITNNNVTLAKLTQNRVVSSNISYTTSVTSSGTAITNATVTITTTGQPVRIGMMPQGSGASIIGLAVNSGGATNIYGQIYLVRDSTTIGVWDFGGYATNAASNASSWITPGGLIMEDLAPPSAGSHTYTYYGYVSASAVTLSVSNLIVFAEEIR